jgi:hypothetical protein
MTSKDSTQDQELLDRYRHASDTDPAAPSDAVRGAILAESRRVADELAAKRSAQPFDASRPAANDSRWKITAFGTAGAALLAALLIAPRYWESLPTAKTNAAPVSAPTAAPVSAPTAAPATAPEDTSGNADAAAGPAAVGARQADSKKREQNYAPAPLALKPSAAPPVLANAPAPVPGQNAIVSQAPTPALEPVPAPVVAPARAPSAPPASLARASGAALSVSADRAARVSRERSETEPGNLESAAAAGDLAQTTRLLDQGATVNARDALGRTPLLLAVAQNRPEAVRLLLARGADPNAADNAGVTPLRLAKDKDLRDVAVLLERAGAR